MARFFNKIGSTVLLDIDTQFDMLPAKSSERNSLLLKWRRIMAWGRLYRLPVISLALTNREDDNILGQQMCVEYTPGHEKVRYTILANHRRYDAEHCLDLPPDIMEKYRQVIFERREFDPFMCDRFERLVNNFPFNHYILFGGAFEASVKLAGLGILSRNKKVTLIKDATASIFDSEHDYALKKLDAKGAELLTTRSLTSQSPTGKQIRNNKKKKSLVIQSSSSDRA